jgi:hypothetical protein
MADFFSRLAERALGAAPLVRPNLPSIFAPAPMIETAVEVVAPRANYFAAQNDQPRAVIDSTMADEPAQSRAPELQPTETGRRRSLTAPAPIEASRNAGELSADNFVFAAESGEAKASSRRNLTAAEQADLVPSADARQTQEMIPDPILTRPMRSTVSSSDTFAFERSRHAPSVQVTIGRVEVRAVTAPAARAPVAERKSPLRSLDQYLRERNEGRR